MSAAIAVRPLRLPEESARLFELPRRLHADSPAWVAPLERFEMRRLNPSNAFFEHAELVVFGAFRGDRLVGTCSAMKDRTFDKEPGVVWFGWFECEDDPEIPRALFERVDAAARAWGGTTLRGPRNLTRWEYAGLTVSGHDRAPPMLQGFHPARYAEHLEALGFTKHHDVLAYEIELYEPDGSERPIPAPLQAKADACAIDGLEVRRARWRSMHRDLVAAHDVLNLAYQTVPDVSPMPRAQFLALGRVYLLFANAELLRIARVNGAPAAFAVCLPEINEALIHARGRLTGIPRALRSARGIRTAAFKLIGVDPRYRGTGLHARMIVDVVQGARRAGYGRIDGSVIDERNGPMRAVVEGVGMTEYRRYRFYERAL